jgi:hypothetical protein
MAKNKGYVFLNTKIGDPVPGEHAFNSDGNVLAVRFDEFEEGCRVSFDVLVDPNLAFGV